MITGIKFIYYIKNFKIKIAFSLSPQIRITYFEVMLGIGVLTSCVCRNLILVLKLGFMPAAVGGGGVFTFNCSWLFGLGGPPGTPPPGPLLVLPLVLLTTPEFPPPVLLFVLLLPRVALT